MNDELHPYPKYKETGVPWLGEVPGHWEVLPGRACYLEKKVSNSGLKETQVLSLSYGQIVVKPQEKLRGLVPASFETYQIVEPNDIIVRPTDLQNDWNSLRFGIARDRGIITSAYMCLNTLDVLNPEYGHLMLHTYDLKKVFYGLGSGLRQNLDWRDFKYLPCVVPPLPEQTAIVRYLEHADRQIRRFVRNRRRLIEVLNEQKQAIISQAVTRGLDPNVRLKQSGVEWLGDVPEHWEVRPLKRVLTRLIDCEHKTAPAVDESPFRVVRTTAVRHGKLRMEGTYCTTAEAYAEWTKRGVPQAGDVIFTREAPAGEACMVPDNLNVCLGQRTVLMKVNRDYYVPEFLVHMIYGGPPANQIRLASQGSTVGHFNMDDIASMQVLCPPVEEQQEVKAAVRERTVMIDLAITQAEEEITLIREYRTRLIADVVTGKVDVRAAAALPELLEVEDALADEPLEAETMDEEEEAELEDPENGDGYE